MKRIILLAVLTAGIVFSSMAQEIRFGVQASFNMSSFGKGFGDFADDQNGDKKIRPGFDAGIYMDLGLGKMVYIQPGVFYSNKGAKVKWNDNGSVRQDLTYNIGYITVPILLSFRIPFNQYNKWHLNVGPYWAYGIHGKAKGTVDMPVLRADTELHAFGNNPGEAGLKRNDFGLSFGTGFSFHDVYVGVKYEMGLLDRANNLRYGDYKFKNNSLAISLGYTF